MLAEQIATVAIKQAGAAAKASQAKHCSEACLQLLPIFNLCLQVSLQLWQLDKQGQRQGAPVLETSSTSGALETGGGPWPGTWTAQAKMQQPLRSIVQIPINVKGITEALPGKPVPPGL